MTSFTLGSHAEMRPSFSKERLLWMLSPALAFIIHLLVLMFVLWQPDNTPPPVPQSPAAAPIVVTMAALPTTSQLSSVDSVVQQASRPDETPPAPTPVKLDVAEKEVKNAEVKAVVHDARPQPRVEPVPRPAKPTYPPRTRTKPPQPKKTEVKKTVEVTTPASSRSNSSEQLSRQSQAPQVGAASNQAATLRQNWQSAMLAQLQREKRYPAYALRMRQQDTVMVRFVIDRDGKVLDSEIVRSQGYAALDRESLQLLDRASPLLKPPTSAFTNNTDRMELVVPISFIIRNS